MHQRSVHPGRYMQWHKMVGDEGGYQTVAMGECWTCCVSEDKGAAGCAAPAIYSDMSAVSSLGCGETFQCVCARVYRCVCACEREGRWCC